MISARRLADLLLDEMHERPLRVGRAAFAMADAVAAETMAPVNLRANRKNYYLVQLAGPPPPEWLNAIRATGARIHDAVAQDTLLVGMLPATVPTLAAMDWVEEITPYHPSMKAPQQFYSEIAHWRRSIVRCLCRCAKPDHHGRAGRVKRPSTTRMALCGEVEYPLAWVSSSENNKMKSTDPLGGRP